MTFVFSSLLLFEATIKASHTNSGATFSQVTNNLRTAGAEWLANLFSSANDLCEEFSEVVHKEIFEDKEPLIALNKEVTRHFFNFFDVVHIPNWDQRFRELVKRTSHQEWVPADCQLPKEVAIRNYFLSLFNRIIHEGKLEFWAMNATFNTGLKTIDGRAIYVMLEENDEAAFPFRFKGFFAQSEHYILKLLASQKHLPEEASFSLPLCHSCILPHLPADINSTHIIYDHPDRFPSYVLAKYLPCNLLKSSKKQLTKDEYLVYVNSLKQYLKENDMAAVKLCIELTLAIERLWSELRKNPTPSIPIYYGKKNQIMHMNPISFGQDGEADMYIIIKYSEIEKKYIIVTAITPDMAFLDANLTRRMA